MVKVESASLTKQPQRDKENRLKSSLQAAHLHGVVAVLTNTRNPILSAFLAATLGISQVMEIIYSQHDLDTMNHLLQCLLHNNNSICRILGINQQESLHAKPFIHV